MQRERLIQLLNKYHLKNLTDAERIELSDFMDRDNAEEMLSTVWNADVKISPVKFEINEIALLDKVMGDKRLVFKTHGVKIKRLRPYQRIMAASIISILFAVSIIWVYRFYSNNYVQESLLTKNEIISPGSKSAHMKFEDGTYFSFDDIKMDTVLLDKGMHIKVSEDGNVSYEILNKKKSLTYTTVYTPRGGEYSLTLADGSQVWLNSESKIKYPLEFSKDYREVEIEGEVYFDVISKTNGTKKVPFRVRTNSQVIEVLGTQFNVNAYSNNIYTTLIEGSVAVSNNLSKEKLVLLPSQQCVYSSNDGNMKKSDVDPYYFVAWRSGKFAFRSATIHQVMEDLARWYDVEIIYVGDFRNITYSGSISKLENFDEVLKLIELTNKFKFKIEGRRVTVTKT